MYVYCNWNGGRHKLELNRMNSKTAIVMVPKRRLVMVPVDKPKKIAIKRHIVKHDVKVVA